MCAWPYKSSSASCIKMELCSGNIGRLPRHPGTMTLLHPTYHLVLSSFSWMSSRWLQMSYIGDMYARDRSVQWCGGLPWRRGWTAVCWPWESWVPARPDQVRINPPTLSWLEMRLAITSCHCHTPRVCGLIFRTGRSDIVHHSKSNSCLTGCPLIVLKH